MYTFWTSAKANVNDGLRVSNSSIIIVAALSDAGADQVMDAIAAPVGPSTRTVDTADHLTGSWQAYRSNQSRVSSHGELPLLPLLDIVHTL
jgi:hypothetical protein